MKEGKSRLLWVFSQVITMMARKRLAQTGVCRRDHRFSLVLLVKLTNLVENGACQE